MRAYPLRRARGMGQTTGANSQYTPVALIVQTVEGYFPGSVSYTNNNPGNLMYAGQAGATGQDANGFAVFPTYAAGFQALLNQIALNASSGMTISQFTAAYAPASVPGNNPTSYANTIASSLGLSPSDPLSAAGSTAPDATVPVTAGVDLASIGLPSLDLSDPTTIAMVALGAVVAVVLLRELV